MSAETISRTIMLILAPVVMFSACSIFVGGVLSHYTSLSDRLRALTRERLELVRALRTMRDGPDGARAIARERLEEIDGQLPDLLGRHRLVHHAALAVYGAIGVFVAGVLAMLLGVGLITVEVRASRRALQYEVRRVVGLAPDPDLARVTDDRAPRTVHA
jgi:hypothetical protein